NPAKHGVALGRSKQDQVGRRDVFRRYLRRRLHAEVALNIERARRIADGIELGDRQVTVSVAIHSEEGAVEGVTDRSLKPVTLDDPAGLPLAEPPPARLSRQMHDLIERPLYHLAAIDNESDGLVLRDGAL